MEALFSQGHPHIVLINTHVRSLFCPIQLKSSWWPLRCSAVMSPPRLRAAAQHEYKDALIDLLAPFPQVFHGLHLNRPCDHVLYSLGSKSPWLHFHSTWSFSWSCAPLRRSARVHSSTNYIYDCTKRWGYSLMSNTQRELHGKVCTSMWWIVNNAWGTICAHWKHVSIFKCGLLSQTLTWARQKTNQAQPEPNSQPDFSVLMFSPGTSTVQSQVAQPTGLNPTTISF